ncbi:gem (nuclear organelle) associated protein 2 [Coemansia sp. RSA 2675]|nr:gem (nuclear organelle) associated protein 2 [Coemansia sp. RSA 2675]
MDDSPSDIVYGQRGALPVPRNVVPGDLSTEPESGEQYMLRVRMEAASIPNVVVANNRHQLLLTSNPEKLPLVGTSPASHCLPLNSVAQPSGEWLSDFERYFAQQRRHFRAALAATNIAANPDVPGISQAKEWRTYCYNISDGNCQMLATLAHIDQPMTMRLLKWMTTWLSKDQLRRVEAIWLWYLLLSLDSLLDHEDTHALRELCRALLRIRSIVATSFFQERGEEIASLNILVAAVTRGYRQRDLE